MIIDALMSILIILGLLTHESIAGDINFDITAIPLTTIEQKKQGVEGGEGFQKVLSIAFAPSDPNIVYFSSDTSQVWKSKDGGKSWFPVNNNYIANGGRSLYVHPTDQNIVFSAGTLGKSYERLAGKKEPYQGIYRSIDGGLHWTIQHLSSFCKQESSGSLFAIDSNTANDEKFTIYAGTHSGELLVSVDSGETWGKTGFRSEKPILEIVESPNEAGIIIIATENGLYRYSKKGIEEIGDGLPTWPRSIAVSKDDPNIMYAALGRSGVYKSDNQGRSFYKIYAGLVNSIINDIEVSQVDSNIAIFIRNGMKNGPYFTHNGGKDWQRSESINAHGLTEGGGFYYPSPVAFHPTNKNIALTSSNGKARVLLTTDGGENWFYSGSGYRGARLSDVLSISKDVMIFGLTDHGLWKTEDGAKSFKQIQIPSYGGRSVSAIATSKNALVISAGTWTRKRLIASNDDGESWKEIGISGKLDSIKKNDSASEILYTGKNISHNGGMTWKKQKYEIAGIDVNNGNTLYALNQVGKSTQLVKSVDQGIHWQNYGDPLGLPLQSVHKIEIDPFERFRIYAATNSGLWVLANKKWYQRTEEHGLFPDSFGGKNVSVVVAHPKWPGLIFAGKGPQGKGMSNGLFYSVDYGESWHRFNDKVLLNTIVWSINVNKFDGTFYVGTSHGIYKIEIKADKKK